MDERVEEIPAETEEDQSSVEQQREQTENSNESGETAAETKPPQTPLLVGTPILTE